MMFTLMAMMMMMMPPLRFQINIVIDAYDKSAHMRR